MIELLGVVGVGKLAVVPQYEIWEVVELRPRGVVLEVYGHRTVRLPWWRRLLRAA